MFGFGDFLPSREGVWLVRVTRPVADGVNRFGAVAGVGGAIPQGQRNWHQPSAVGADGAV